METFDTIYTSSPIVVGEPFRWKRAIEVVPSHRHQTPREIVGRGAIWL